MNMLTNPPSRAAAHVECELVVLDFMAAFDAGDAEAAVELFSPDGQWNRIDGPVNGRDELVSLIRSRSPAVMVRHVITNVRTNLTSESTATVNSYVMLARHQSSTGSIESLPVPFEGLAGLGCYVDELKLIDGRWKIVKRYSRSEFKR